MPSLDILNFTKLLDPIPGDMPAGVDLRLDDSPASVYQEVRDARLANRAAERQLLAGGDEANPPDWQGVLQRGSEVLAEMSKDLEIAAYVIEALVRLHGFAGLRDGFRLARELVERFWDHLFPVPDEDGLETRLAPLAGLNGLDGEGTLIGPIRCVPLTHGDNSLPLACYHFQQAIALGRAQDETVRDNRLQEGLVDLATVERAVAQTPRRFYAALVEDLAQCREEFERLCQALDEKAGVHAPPSSNIRNALAACQEALERLAGAKLPRPDEDEAPHANGRAAANGAAAAPQAGAGETLASTEAVTTRAEAFRLLLEVAEFFRRTEPQSVVSFGLEQVVRWGKMSLPALLRELIPDDGSREFLFRQVGIRAAQAANESEQESAA
jgi:type VI secretion system protein ImpA